MTAPPAVAPSSRMARAARHTAVTELSLQLLDRVLTVRVHLSLADRGQARQQLLRAFDALALLDDALTSEPPAAPAAGPRHVQETAP